MPIPHRRGAAALAAALALVGLTGVAAARSDVPITQTVLPDGAIRYSVPITVGDGPPVEAMLDTGSFGIRVLKSALASGQYDAAGRHVAYNFGGGIKLEGVLARGVLGVGDARTAAPAVFEAIDTVACTEQRPNCPAAHIAPGDYRIGGDGYPGQGFSAIFGLSLQHNAAADSAQNPLAAAGRSWIVILPRPGAAEPGRLIVDPDPAERDGFATVQLSRLDDSGFRLTGWADAALPGCLVPEAGGERFCGPTLLDSGTAHVVVMTDTVSGFQPWGAGKKARLEIGGPGGPASVSFTSGQTEASHVILRPPWRGGTQIITGTLPFFSYAVLFDAATGTVGFKPRPPADP